MSAPAFIGSSAFSTASFRPNPAQNAISTRIHKALGVFTQRRPRVISPALPSVASLRMAQGDASQGQRSTAKQLAQLYGGSYLGTSIGLSIVSYIVLYFMIAAGVDVRGLVNAFGNWLAITPVGRPSILDSISDTASTATLAYIAHKVISPIRFPLTVAATPVVARVFSKKEKEQSENDSSNSS